MFIKFVRSADPEDRFPRKQSQYSLQLWQNECVFYNVAPVELFVNGSWVVTTVFFRKIFDTLHGLFMDVDRHGSMCRTKVERHNVISFGISTRHGFAMSRSKMGSKSCDTLLQRFHLPNPDSKILLFACFLTKRERRAFQLQKFSI